MEASKITVKIGVEKTPELERLISLLDQVKDELNNLKIDCTIDVETEQSEA